MNTLDDDRRDIAVIGDLDAKQLNRMAKRNHGRNPFEVSGDAITSHNKNGGHDSDQEPVTTTSHNTLQENEMTTINSTRYSVRTASDGIHHVFDEKTGKSVDIETDHGLALRMAAARNHDDSLPAPKHLSWCIPERCTSHGGPDVIHEGKTMRLERSNKNGDSFSFSATPTQLEERGFGYTTEKYVSLTIDSEPFGITHLNIDIDELEGAVDWMCGVVEKVKSQGDGPGLKL